MKNLVYCIIPIFILSLVLLLIAIIQAITKQPKKALVSFLVFLICATIYVIFIWPYFKDIIHKETITFEGVYTKYIGKGSGNLLLTSKNYFTNDGDEISVYISDFQFSKYNLNKGNKYKITYYKYSHAVCNIELINE